MIIYIVILIGSVIISISFIDSKLHSICKSIDVIGDRLYHIQRALERKSDK